MSARQKRRDYARDITRREFGRHFRDWGPDDFVDRPPRHTPAPKRKDDDLRGLGI